MAIETATLVTRIPLDGQTDLKKALEDECELQAALDQHRRLAATFAAGNQVILIFQRTID